MLCNLRIDITQKPVYNNGSQGENTFLRMRMASKFCVRQGAKPQEYFAYFKVFATQAGAKFAARRARGFIQRFPRWVSQCIPNPDKPEKWSVVSGQWLVI